MKQIPKRKDSFQPQIDPDGINNGVVNHDGGEETLSQCLCEHWLNNGGVVPNVECAPENLRDQRRQGGKQKPVTRAKCVFFNFGGHNVDVI